MQNVLLAFRLPLIVALVRNELIGVILVRYPTMYTSGPVKILD